MSRTLAASRTCIREMVLIDLAGSDISKHIDALAARHGLFRYQVEELAGSFAEYEVEIEADIETE